MLCERCNKQVYKLGKCDNCSKSICSACVKSSKTVNKTDRHAICKSCWGKMQARRRFKRV
ncbi:MAG: hypothetical protein ABIH99_05690 [Candidatus Micrarchaeota archaeon]